MSIRPRMTISVTAGVLRIVRLVIYLVGTCQPMTIGRKIAESNGVNPGGTFDTQRWARRLHQFPPWCEICHSPSPDKQPRPIRPSYVRFRPVAVIGVAPRSNPNFLTFGCPVPRAPLQTTRWRSPRRPVAPPPCSDGQTTSDVCACKRQPPR